MDLHVQPIYLASVIALWIIFYNVVYGLVAIARDRSLVFWSVGPFGVTVASLRSRATRPSDRRPARHGSAGSHGTGVCQSLPDCTSAYHWLESTPLVAPDHGSDPCVSSSPPDARWAYFASAFTLSGARRAFWCARRRAWPPAPASTSRVRDERSCATASARHPTNSCVWCAERQRSRPSDQHTSP